VENSKALALGSVYCEKSKYIIALSLPRLWNWALSWAWGSLEDCATMEQAQSCKGKLLLQ